MITHANKALVMVATGLGLLKGGSAQGAWFRGWVSCKLQQDPPPKRSERNKEIWNAEILGNDLEIPRTTGHQNRNRSRPKARPPLPLMQEERSASETEPPTSSSKTPVKPAICLPLE